MRIFFRLSHAVVMDEATSDFIDVPENPSLKAVFAEVQEEGSPVEYVGEDDPLEQKQVAELYICGAIAQPEAYFNDEPYEQAILQIIGGLAHFLDDVYYQGPRTLDEEKAPTNRWGVVHLLDRDEDESEEKIEGVKQWSFMALWKSKTEGMTDIMYEADEDGKPITTEKWYTDDEEELAEGEEPKVFLHATLYPQIGEHQVATCALAMSLNANMPDGSAIIHYFD